MGDRPGRSSGPLRTQQLAPDALQHPHVARDGVANSLWTVDDLLAAGVQPKWRPEETLACKQVADVGATADLVQAFNELGVAPF